MVSYGAPYGAFILANCNADIFLDALQDDVLLYSTTNRMLFGHATNPVSNSCMQVNSNAVRVVPDLIVNGTSYMQHVDAVTVLADTVTVSNANISSLLTYQGKPLSLTEFSNVSFSNAVVKEMLHTQDATVLGALTGNTGSLSNLTVRSNIDASIGTFSSVVTSVVKYTTDLSIANTTGGHPIWVSNGHIGIGTRPRGTYALDVDGGDINLSGGDINLSGGGSFLKDGLPCSLVVQGMAAFSNVTATDATFTSVTASNISISSNFSSATATFTSISACNVGNITLMSNGYTGFNTTPNWMVDIDGDINVGGNLLMYGRPVAMAKNGVITLSNVTSTTGTVTTLDVLNVATIPTLITSYTSASNATIRVLTSSNVASSNLVAHTVTTQDVKVSRLFAISNELPTIILDSSNIGLGKSPQYSLDVLGDINYTGTLYRDGQAAIVADNAIIVHLMGSNATMSNLTVTDHVIALNILGSNVSAFNILGSNVSAQNILGSNATVSNLTVYDRVSAQTILGSNATMSNLTVYGSTSSLNILGSNATMSNLTVYGSTSSLNILGSNATMSNLTVYGSTSSLNILGSNATVSNLTVYGSTSSLNILGSNATVSNLTVSDRANVVYLVGSNATVSNLIVYDSVNALKLVGSNAAVSNLTVYDSVSALKLVGSNATFSNTTASNIYGSNGTFTWTTVNTGTFSNISISVGGFIAMVGSNLTSSNASFGSLKSSNAAFINVSGSNGTFVEIQGSNAMFNNMTFSNGIGSNASFSNVYCSSGSFSNVYGSNAIFYTSSASNVFGSNATFSNIYGSNAVITSVTTSNVYSSNIRATNIITTSNITLINISSNLYSSNLVSVGGVFTELVVSSNATFSNAAITGTLDSSSANTKTLYNSNFYSSNALVKNLTGSNAMFSNIIVNESVTCSNAIADYITVRSNATFSNLNISGALLQNGIPFVSTPYIDSGLVTTLNSNLILQVGNVNTITCDSNGHVGIGVAPIYNLDVGGDINFTGRIMKNGVPYSSGTTVLGDNIALLTVNDIVASNVITSGFMVIPRDGLMDGLAGGVGGSQSVILASNIGIGTTSPLYPLHVASTSSGVSGYFSGNVVAQNVSVPSDARVKTNVSTVDVERAKELIKGIKSRTFTYIDQTSSDLHTGFIAQELEQACPECVGQMYEFIPNIYKNVMVASWSADGLGGSCCLNGGLKRGDKLKVCHGSQTHVVLVTDCVDNVCTLSTDIPILIQSGDSLFVYGVLVDDFKTVNYLPLVSLLVAVVQSML